MKNRIGFSKRRASQGGFTLIELAVAMSVFLVIAGAALVLFRRHAPLFRSQQGQSGMNIALRNSIAQMQIDAINAGAGFGVNNPGWDSVGITVVNRKPASGGTCNTASTFTYGTNCFDTFNIIAADPNTPAAHPSGLAGIGCADTNASTDVYLTPTGGTTATAMAAMLKTGDQVMLVNSNGTQMTAVVLTGNGVVSGGQVKIQHAVTASNGSNTAANDPPQITTSFPPAGTVLTGSTNPPPTVLGKSFCVADWAYKLSVVTYSVDTSTASNPKLVRTQGGTSNVLAEQVVGFRVGAMIWNGSDDTSLFSYDPTTYIAYTPASTDWTAIRALRISLIARSSPSTDATIDYTNTFDGGRYKVQAISTVINPRNLSMND
jgi:prepilin-type N-terminal cleavage/methylation domain-containing protein